MKKLFVSLLVVIISTCSLFAKGNNEMQKKEVSGSVKENVNTLWVPDRDITIRVPFAAGGSADTFTRIYAKALQESYDNSVIVSNVLGANGAVAAADLDMYDPSPCEMMVSGISLFTSTPLFNPEINVDLDKYEIVTSLVAEEFILCTAPQNTGISNWDSFVQYAKNNRMLCASNPPGGTTHMLASVLFGESNLNNVEEVPTQGGNKSLISLVSGDVDCAIVAESQVMQYVEEGKVVPILAFSKLPYDKFPEMVIPNAKSLGFDIVFKSCNFVLVKKGVDKKILKQIYDKYIEFQETDEFKKLANSANYIPSNETGEEVRDNINNSAKLFKDIYNKYYK